MYKITRSSGKQALMSGPGLGGKGLYARQSCPRPSEQAHKEQYLPPTPDCPPASLTTPKTAPCRRVTDWEEGQSFATSVVKYTRSSKHFVGIL